ncbi:Striatin-interacting protein 1 [Eumeta japonica]|uniref:Striatin-interacting protein 1 n=1 Tax=Eumeta variegata TaxID=151549 RepID=A0A4C1VJ83_EUMVA|nr:Striatin-interacting protein 1 [Eumeta japonica]
MPDIRRPMEEGDSVNDVESPELDFEYDDCDCQANEIAELYSYTEHPEFQLNVKAFEDIMEEFNFPPSWQRLTKEQQKTIVMKLLEHLDVAISDIRMRAIRCILYLAQGCWAEMQSDAEQQNWARRNVMILYEMGIFPAFVELLNLEIVKSNAAIPSRKLAESLADSTNLRVILSVLYLITEYMRTEKDNPQSEYAHLVGSFREEIGTPFGDELLPVKLLSMVTHLCGATTHFPMKKVLLLLWKLLLVYLGGSKELKERKAKLRKNHDLPPLIEDPLEIIKGMRASSPPPSALDMLENQNPGQRKVKESERVLRRLTFMKQTSLDESDEQIFVDKEETGNGSEDFSMEFQSVSNEDTQNSNSNQSCPYYMYFKQFESPPPPPLPRGLPWQSKVRQKDIDMFLDNVRIKFVGYSLPGDRQTIAGLPQPIHEGIEILKKHMYISLSDLQIERELEIARSPLTKGEKEVEETEAEVLYRAMFPNLPQHMIALLKILLAASPTSTAKTYSINIMADVLPEEMPMTVLQSLKLRRQWRKTNMKTISAIYSKVRHRLNDDWAFGNDVDARPWDFQDEECALRVNVDRFNQRRYGTGGEQELEFMPFDTDINSVLETNVELDEEFKENYELWLEQEVYNNEINWDILLSS